MDLALAAEVAPAALAPTATLQQRLAVVLAPEVLAGTEQLMLQQTPVTVEVVLVRARPAGPSIPQAARLAPTPGRVVVVVADMPVVVVAVAER